MNRIVTFALTAFFLLTGCGPEVTFFKGKYTHTSGIPGQAPDTSSLDGTEVIVSPGATGNELIVELNNNAFAMLRSSPTGPLGLVTTTRTMTVGNLTKAQTVTGTGTLTADRLTLNWSYSEITASGSSDTTTATGTITFDGSKL